MTAKCPCHGLPGIEGCGGCGWPVENDRDCGCPCGTALFCQVTYTKKHLLWPSAMKRLGLAKPGDQ